MSNNLSNSSKGDNKTDSAILFRKRALTNLIIMPLFLLAFGILGLMIWDISLKWTSVSDSLLKTLFGISGLFILLLELFLVYIFLHFTRWVYTGEKSHVLKNLRGWALFTSVDLSLPLKRRLLTMVILFPILLIVDVGLVVLILTTILIINKISIINYLLTDWLFLSFCSLIDILGSIYLVYVNINLIYWVVNGRPMISQSK
jgi:hypothetical protein